MAVIDLKYDGTSIADAVIFADATFVSTSNGEPGTCQFRVKDPNHDKEFVLGKRLELYVDDLIVWSGYVMGSSRVYAFEAMDTTNPSTMTRLLRVDGSDINILFQRRIVFDQGSPLNVEGPSYPVNTHDDTVFQDLVDNFLTIGDDDLDTTTRIQHVGTVNTDHVASPIQPSETWANTMNSIIALSGAFYAISPDRKVVLADVDTVTAPFRITDNIEESLGSFYPGDWQAGGSWDAGSYVRVGDDVWYTAAGGTAASLLWVSAAETSEVGVWISNGVYGTDYLNTSQGYFPIIAADGYLFLIDQLIYPTQSTPAGVWSDQGLAPDWAADSPVATGDVVLGDFGIIYWNFGPPFTTGSTRPSPFSSTFVDDGDGQWVVVGTWIADAFFGDDRPIVPTTPNGHTYRTNTGGLTSGDMEPVFPTDGGTVEDGYINEDNPTYMSGDVEPTWPTALFDTVPDGDIMWRNMGADVDWQPTTAYEQNQFIDTGSLIEAVISNSGTSGADYPAFALGENTPDPLIDFTPPGPVTDGTVTWTYVSSLDDYLAALAATLTGCREFTWYLDGNRMVNDALVWGAGMGQPTVGFERATDQDSIDQYGRWQYGEFNTAIYKAQTIQRRADAIVYGSPQSKRGGNQPPPVVDCVIFRPGIQVGMVANIESWVWNQFDALPVRRVEITFPTPTDAKFRLRLSHEIDIPWNFYDIVPFKPIEIPRDHIPVIPVPKPPRNQLEDPCTGATFGHDPFDNDLAEVTGPFDGTTQLWPGWGPWFEGDPPFGTSDDAASAHDGAGYLTVTNYAYGVRQTYSATSPVNRDTVIGTFKFTFDDVASTGTPYMIRFVYGAATVELQISSDTGGEVRLLNADATSDFQAKTDWVADTPYTLTISLDLPNNALTASIDGVDLAVDSAGERVGDGPYQPYVGIWVENTSMTPFTITMDDVTASAYITVPSTYIDFGPPGSIPWGPPWTGTPHGMTWESFGETGRITLDDDVFFSGSMTQELGHHGSMDLMFSLSEYPLTDRFLQMQFGEENVFVIEFGQNINLLDYLGNDDHDGSPYFTGSPVDVRINIFNGIRVKLWAHGDPEPDDWTYERGGGYSLLSQNYPWRIDSFLDVAGQTILIGAVTGATTPLGIFAPDAIADPQGTYSGGTTGASGRSKSWPFEDPADGRSYAVTWGSESFTADEINTPSYGVSMAWGLFGDYGPGAPREASQTAASVHFAGTDDTFYVILRGRIRVSMGGTPDGGGSGLATVTAAIQTFNYGNDTAAPPPSFADYNLIGGNEASFLFNVEAGVETEWQDFSIVAANGSSNGGINPDDGGFNFQWSAYIEDPFTALAGAGPLTSGFFLPNTGSLFIEFADITAEAYHTPTSIFRVNQCAATNWHEIDADGLKIYLASPFRPGSVILFIGGRYFPPSTYDALPEDGIIVMHDPFDTSSRIDVSYDPVYP